MQKVVFFGSSEYSVTILKSLLNIDGFKVVAVISKEDKPFGRNQSITPNPVAKFAKENKLPLMQPSEFDPDFIDKFKSLQPDLGLVVAYGPPYFTQEMIDIPKFKVVNIHPSPLPKYRGATPGPWQIINGESKSAVTFFRIDVLPDHGPIISQLPLNIDPKDTALIFYQKAFNIAASNLKQVLQDYVNNPQNITVQDHGQKTYFPKFTKESAQIDWNWTPEKIERFVRGLIPWPIAWTYVKNQQDQQVKMKIFSGVLVNGQFIPKSVQIEGKKPVLWQEIDKYYQIVR